MCTYADGENRFGYFCSVVYCFHCFGLFRCIKLENSNETQWRSKLFRRQLFGAQFATVRYNKENGISHLRASLTTCSSKIAFLFTCSFVSQKKVWVAPAQIYLTIMRTYHKNIINKFIIYTQNDIYRCKKNNYFDLCFS